MHTTLDDTAVHSTPNARMQRYPGSSLAVWRTTTAPGASGPLHHIDREHVVVVVAGQLSASVDGLEHLAGPGDAVVLPAGVARQLRNDGEVDLVTITAAIPGSTAQVGDGAPVAVPWAQ
jgi:quercetin dioxygenase-like cupin family protein